MTPHSGRELHGATLRPPVGSPPPSAQVPAGWQLPAGYQHNIGTPRSVHNLNSSCIFPLNHLRIKSRPSTVEGRLQTAKTVLAHKGAGHFEVTRIAGLRI